MTYVGRFAPSPTGPLHFGSLVAALGSYLDARAQSGRWLVRMEDLDRPREVPGAADLILKSLEQFGFEWDGAIEYQSRREDAYHQAAEELQHSGLLYACGCSRRDIRNNGRMGPEGPVYPGTCRDGLPPGCKRRTLRLRTTPDAIEIDDRLQGRLEQNVEADVGDFIIHRADGLYAYQLAVVVDDAWQGVTHVVRGADLLTSTPRQIYLQQVLGLDHPTYAHLPLAVDEEGRKLSKQRASEPVNPQNPSPPLLAALRHLGQPAPPEPWDDARTVLDWAIRHWNPLQIPTGNAMPEILDAG